MTDHETQSGTRVLVELSGCEEEDAQVVFEALRASFSSDRGPDDVPHTVSSTRPTIWAATFDVRGESGTAVPRRLRTPVMVDIQGGYRAVDGLRSALADSFAVRIVGTASGDQENELQLRVENR